MKTEIDWSKAPEDATHYLPESDLHYACWIKPGFSMREGTQSEWQEDDDDSPFEQYIVRPSGNSGTSLPPDSTVELETFTRQIYQDAGIEPELAERLFAKGYRREAP